MPATQKLSDALGIEASGVELSVPQSDEAFEDIERAFHLGQILVFRGQKLNPAQFVAFAHRQESVVRGIGQFLRHRRHARRRSDRAAR